jgi:hypothetical protein
MVKPKLQFSVKVAEASKPETASKKADPRGLAERHFTNLNSETGAVEPKGISAINCSAQTAYEQGFKTADFHKDGTLPLYLNYKGGVTDFKGPTKGRDFVVVGQRVGPVNRGGNPGQMIDICELDEFIDGCIALRAAALQAIGPIREGLGLPVNEGAAEQLAELDEEEAVEVVVPAAVTTPPTVPATE